MVRCGAVCCSVRFVADVAVADVAGLLCCAFSSWFYATRYIYDDDEQGGEFAAMTAVPEIDFDSLQRLSQQQKAASEEPDRDYVR